MGLEGIQRIQSSNKIIIKHPNGPKTLIKIQLLLETHTCSTSIYIIQNTPDKYDHSFLGNKSFGPFPVFLYMSVYTTLKRH